MSIKNLSKREQEVLRLIAQGKTSKAIGQELGISHKTVDAHRENIKNKSQVKTTAEIVLLAVKNKLIEI